MQCNNDQVQGVQVTESAVDLRATELQHRFVSPVAAALQVTIDNSTTAAYSLINIVCKDRKGLVYDLMRTVKDIHIRVAYGKVHVRSDYMCEADLFVQEVDGSQITEQ